MKSLACGMLLLALLFPATGCRSMFPNVSEPGTEAAQQSRAALYDPFFDNVAGPPVVGGRPRGFERPFAEPVKSSLYDRTIVGP